jgi:hypothetical protein
MNMLNFNPIAKTIESVLLEIHLSSLTLKSMYHPETKGFRDFEEETT